MGRRRLHVGPNLTLRQVIEAARRRHPGYGLSSAGARNNILRTWASAVGRSRAVAELDSYVEEEGGPDAAAQALGVATSTLRGLRRFFGGVYNRDDVAGLTLYFSTKATPVDRFLIDAIIFGTLGFGTDCEVVHFEQRADSAVVRLQAADPAGLVTVADALYERVWEMQDQAQTVALQRLDKVFQLNVMGAVIGTMADKIERMELRLANEIAQRLGDLLGPDAIEMLRDQGAKHIQGKDSKLVMTWTQKGGRALGKSLVKKITGGVSKEIEGEVKSSVKGVLGDE